MTPAPRRVFSASLMLALAAAWIQPAAAQQQPNEPLPPPVLVEPESAEAPTEAEILEQLQEIQQAIEAQSDEQEQQPQQAQHNDPIPSPALENGEDNLQGAQTPQQEQQ